jgi:putative phage-type endonuclease
MDELTRRFLERRQTGIGGSDVGAICGVDPYRGALDVYLDKVESVDDRYREPNLHMQRGIELEPVARRVFREQTMLDVQKARFRRHSVHHFMVCHPDGIITPGPAYDKPGKGVLELKCPSLGHFTRIKAKGVPESWLLQMQHNLVVCNLKWGAFGIFNADRWEMLVILVDRDDGTAQQLVEIERVFWHDYVGTHTPPPQPKQPLVEVPPVAGDTPAFDRTNDSNFRTALRSYSSAKELLDAATEVVANTKADLVAALGEYGVYEAPEGRVHYAIRNGRSRFDRKAMEATAEPLDGRMVREVLHDQPVGLEQRIMACRLDLTEFDVPGTPYPELRVYPTSTQEVAND